MAVTAADATTSQALCINTPTGYALGDCYALSIILDASESVAALAGMLQAVYDDDNRAPAGHFILDVTSTGTAITFLRETGADEDIIGKALTRSNVACQLAREFEPVEGDAELIYRLHAELLAQVDFDPSEIAEEGWQLVSAGWPGAAQIHRAGEGAQFCCDAAAVAFVRPRGLEGSLPHMEAFALHRWGAEFVPDALKAQECACATSATALLCCPQCKSDNIHVVVGECEGEAVFAEDEFEGSAKAICGDCGHKDQAACFAGHRG